MLFRLDTLITVQQAVGVCRSLLLTQADPRWFSRLACDRGAFTVAIKEVGSGPIETLDVLVAAVPKRTDADPPVRIPLAAWYPEEDASDGSPEPA